MRIIFRNANLRWILLLSWLVVGNTVMAASRANPESATGLQRPDAVIAKRMLVVTAHPHATQVGYQVLQRGGSAADAAVAIQAALTLVEPQSSGIGGGAFMLYWDADKQQLLTYDGRETAPGTATSELFVGDDGKPMRWVDALVGGRSVGVPGVLRMLELAHQQQGVLPWSELFDGAVELARQGFEVTPRLQQLLEQEMNPGIKRYSQARDYFYPSGQPLQAGDKLANPQLAQTLQKIAEQGADYLYSGELAQRLVDRVHGASDNPGLLQLEDLADYQAKVRQPLCQPFRQYQVCGMPPPTSGGVTVLQILAMMEHQGLPDLEPQGIDFAHRFSQASRLAYADRGRYLADSDFVNVPVRQLLDRDYLRQRAKLIDPQLDMGSASPGQFDNVAYADDESPELPSTSHFVVVDSRGNAVSMTTSIEMAFGSTLMVDGFLLNNQLTDFSFVAERDGQLIANRVEPGKRPRSSMSPMMVFDQQGRLVLLTGSPGGSRIINYVAQMLLQTLVWGMDPQQVVTLPHISNRNGVTELELDSQAPEQVKALQAGLEQRGHTVKVTAMNSGIHAIMRNRDGSWRSAVDPRREGLALGQ
ncbi:MAG: gamma-glutamyltransferase [Motiliproteus sp.]